MKRILVRFAGALITLVLASMLAFFILESAPGSVVDSIVSDAADQSQRQTVLISLGLDQPLMVRYLLYMKSVFFEGDFGRSLISKRPVAGLVLRGFGYTALLTILSTTLAAAVGILAGSLAAQFQGKWIDSLVMGLMILAVSMPVYGLALFGVQIFAVKLHWLPVLGVGSWKHLVLPTLALALPYSAVLARLMRTRILEIRKSLFIQVEHAKGATASLVWWRHILPNALPPVISMIGLHLGHLLGGAFIIETIFAYPGLGRLTVQAIFEQDFPVVMGAVLFAAVIYQIINLVVDILYGVLDPRVGNQAI